MLKDHARKVWMIPHELSERLREWQESHKIASEVEAARRLLWIAFQSEESSVDILHRLKADLAEHGSLRTAACNVLVTHSRVTCISMGDDEMSFHLDGKRAGRICINGLIFTAREPEGWDAL
jgi:hypothetical protein